MRKLVLLITYIAALMIGVLFLIFNQQARLMADPSTLRGLVIATGIIFIIPGIFMLLFSMRPKRNAEGEIITRPWYLTVMSIASLIWGIMCVSMPAMLTKYLAISLGVTLILAGLAQVIWIVQDSRPYGAPGWWYVIPFCVFCAGIIDLTLINDFTQVGNSSATAAIVSGILLMAFAFNGFISINRRKRIMKEIKDDATAVDSKDTKK